jgi:hypothetical protein
MKVSLSEPNLMLRIELSHFARLKSHVITCNASLVVKQQMICAIVVTTVAQKLQEYLSL